MLTGQGLCRDIKGQSPWLVSRGLTTIELLILVAIVAVLLSLGTVHLLRARASGNEAAAVASLRAILAGRIW